MSQGPEFWHFMHAEPRTTVAVLLVTSCNALAYNVVHYKMIAVRCCWSCLPMLLQIASKRDSVIRHDAKHRSLLAADHISRHHHGDWRSKDHWADGAVSSTPRCNAINCCKAAD